MLEIIQKVAGEELEQSQSDENDDREGDYYCAELLQIFYRKMQKVFRLLKGL